MLQLDGRHLAGQVPFARRLIRETASKAVHWLVAVEDYDGKAEQPEGLGDEVEVSILRPGLGDTMWWGFYRAIRDFRPHVVHALTTEGRDWAAKAGVPWLLTGPGDQERSSGGTVPAYASWGEHVGDCAALYRELVAQPVDIIIVAHNQAELTETCVSQVIGNTWWPYRLILVDNGSSKEEGVEGLFDRVRTLLGEDRCEVLRSGSNVGCGAGRNLAYRHCVHPWIAILDNDMLVCPGWLGRLMRTMEAEPTAGAVAPWNEVYPPGLRASAAHQMAFRAANNLYRAEALEAAEEKKGQLYVEPFVSLQSRDDTDLNWRVLEAGWELWFDGRVEFQHLGGPLFASLGMTRRYADGEAIRRGDLAFSQKWTAEGKRRETEAAEARAAATPRREPAPGQRSLCIVAYQTEPSGGTNTIQRIARYLHERGWFVETALQSLQAAESWEPVPCVTWANVRDEYDVVMATFIATRPLARRIKCALRLGFVQSDEPEWMQGQTAYDEWRAWFELDGFREIIIADHMQHFAKKYGMSIAGQVKLGVDQYCFTPKEAFATGRDPTLSLLVVTKSASVWYDGHKHLVPALKKLARRYPAMVVHWLGYPPPELPCRVVHHQTHDPQEVARLYSQATVFVLPSLIEGSPLTVREAMACGTPVVTTGTGVLDYAVDREHAMIIPQGDAEAIVEAVSELFDKPRERQRIALNALRLIQDHTWDRYQTEFEAIIEREWSALDEDQVSHVERRPVELRHRAAAGMAHH